ncbi:MAG: pro-sigmaK processing inhibitor BofA family protein [Christensenellaceae bacterium]|jgi:pro-sigmaK processing inhibitor bofA|nr:MAG: transcriptional regulator [Clostridiales bacterium]
MLWWQGILVILGVILAAWVLLKLFKVSFKIIWKLLVNALIGGLVLFVLNFIPGVNMPINWLTTILTGLFGVPAVLVIFIVSLF